MSTGDKSRGSTLTVTAEPPETEQRENRRSRQESARAARRAATAECEQRVLAENEQRKRHLASVNELRRKARDEFQATIAKPRAKRDKELDPRGPVPVAQTMLDAHWPAIKALSVANTFGASGRTEMTVVEIVAYLRRYWAPVSEQYVADGLAFLVEKQLISGESAVVRWPLGADGKPRKARAVLGDTALELY